MVFSHPTSETVGQPDPAFGDRPKPSRRALFQEPDNGTQDQVADSA
jgi:hypothetical protein